MAVGCSASPAQLMGMNVPTHERLRGPERCSSQLASPLLSCTRRMRSRVWAEKWSLKTPSSPLPTGARHRKVLLRSGTDDAARELHARSQSLGRAEVRTVGTWRVPGVQGRRC